MHCYPCSCTHYLMNVPMHTMKTSLFSVSISQPRHRFREYDSTCRYVQAVGSSVPVTRNPLPNHVALRATVYCSTDPSGHPRVHVTPRMDLCRLDDVRCWCAPFHATKVISQSREEWPNLSPHEWQTLHI